MVVVSETVQKFILDYIRKKDLRPGDQLPSERELVTLLEVGRSSVREALQTLAEKEIIEKRPGKGAFVKKNPFLHGSDVSQSLMMLMDISSSLDLLEFRRGVEAEIAYLAAKRIEPHEILILEESIHDLEMCIKTETSIIVPDILFHSTLARSTKNQVIIQVFHSISEFFKKVRIEMAINDDVHNALFYHRKILQAIKAGDAPRCANLMREHIEDVRSHYNTMLQELNLKS